MQSTQDHWIDCFLHAMDWGHEGVIQQLGASVWQLHTVLFLNSQPDMFTLDGL